MEYLNNHYVPQLILRRYGNKLNLFNVKTNELKIKKSLKNSFSVKGFYPVELENKLSLFESEFTNLLDKKILRVENEVKLSRSEIWVLVKFAVLSIFRTPHSYLTLKDQKENEAVYKRMGFKEEKVVDETNEEYSQRSIRVILEANDLNEVYNHPNTTYEACKWATLFHNCCLSVLDSTKAKEDFIITDIGMACEHDRSRFITFPVLCGVGPYKNDIDEMLKRGYVYNEINEITSYIKHNKSDEQQYLNKLTAYIELSKRMDYVHANYYIFAVSNTRTISFINPFFKLYFDEGLIKTIGYEPCIWPTLISKEAMRTGSVTYSKNTYSNDDLFTYKIKDIPYEDVIMNCMAIDRLNTWLGYNESGKIIRTLNVYSMIQKECRRNNYDALKKELIGLGYNFPNTQKYKDISNLLTGRFFTEKDMFYIEYFFKNVVLPSRNH